MTKKTVLFVTYGGGHARMVVPVVRALQQSANIHIETLALTAGGAIFKSEGLPYKGYKDFLRADDVEARAWGEKLAAESHNPESGMELAESIAYLGLSYMDLVTRHGEEGAARLWREKGRHAFLQLTVMQRVLDALKPDLVVTTNSPKSEQAAVSVARARGILTLSMTDLFGIYHFHAIEADYITVLYEGAIDNMLAEGVTRPREAFLITGNPAFDQAIDYRGPVDVAWRAQHFPKIPEKAKTLLWIDVHAYWQNHLLHMRSDEEILRDLDDLAQATKEHNGTLLIRPHPSQQRRIYDEWMERTGHAHVFFAGGVPLYPLLKAVDVVATYTSTVSVEALLMQRRLLQLQYYSGQCDVPLGEWGMAWLARNREQLSDRVGKAFNDHEEAARIQKRVEEILPQEKAGPKIAAEIIKILGA